VRGLSAWGHSGRLTSSRHTIERLVFGEEDLEHGGTSEAMPLDGRRTMVNRTVGQTAAMQYFAHLVPTLDAEAGRVLYRFSASEQYVPVLDPVPDAEHVTEPRHSSPQLDRISVLPGVYVTYSFSPFLHVREPKYMHFSDVLVDVLAIAGGLVATVRLVDAAAHLVGL